MDATNRRYHEFARILHWLIAGLIVVQFVLAELAEDATSDLQELVLLANHKSVGMTVLMLAIVRLGWRLTHPVPGLPSTMPSWQILASKVSHGLLYFLIFAMPVSGWLFSSATSYSVSWFNVFVFPDLVGGNEALAETLEDLHEAMATILFVVALLHILAALKHGIFDRDGVLGGMSSWLSIALFVLAIAVGLTVLIVPAKTASEPTAPAAAPSASIPAATDAVAAPEVHSSLPLWTVDMDNSDLRFTTEQAGAPFTGTWQRWTARVRFSPDDLAASSAEIRVDVASPSTGDAERDSTLVQAEWFDSVTHPEAIFRSVAITAGDAGGFRATGTLRIRNREHPVLLEFTHGIVDGVEVIEGHAELDRLALGLGSGEWADTSWVGQAVRVEFRVTRGM